MNWWRTALNVAIGALVLYTAYIVWRFTRGAKGMQTAIKMTKDQSIQKIRDYCAQIGATDQFVALFLALAEIETSFQNDFKKWDVHDFSWGIFSMQGYNYQKYGNLDGYWDPANSIDAANAYFTAWIAKRDSLNYPHLPFPISYFLMWNAPGLHQPAQNPAVEKYCQRGLQAFIRWGGQPDNPMQP